MKKIIIILLCIGNILAKEGESVTPQEPVKERAEITIREIPHGQEAFLQITEEEPGLEVGEYEAGLEEEYPGQEYTEEYPEEEYPESV